MLKDWGNYTQGPWKWACDSYGKVLHSRKACVYVSLLNAEGETTGSTKVAAQIASWEDAKLISKAYLIPRLERLLEEAKTALRVELGAWPKLPLESAIEEALKELRS